MIDRPDWDTLFIAMAYLAAMRSPDEETKHGAIVVDKKHRVLGTGFNGFPRGCVDENLPTLRPGKYPFVIHAEVNALINSREIVSPETCTIYVTGEPCNECFKLIVQYGIGRVCFGQVGSNCIDSDEQHLLIRRAIAEGIEVKTVVYDDAKAIVNLLEQTAGYVGERSGLTPGV